MAGSNTTEQAARFAELTNNPEQMAALVEKHQSALNDYRSGLGGNPTPAQAQEIAKLTERYQAAVTVQDTIQLNRRNEGISPPITPDSIESYPGLNQPAVAAYTPGPDITVTQRALANNADAQYRTVAALSANNAPGRDTAVQEMFDAEERRVAANNNADNIISQNILTTSDNEQIQVENLDSLLNIPSADNLLGQLRSQISGIPGANLLGLSSPNVSSAASAGSTVAPPADHRIRLVPKAGMSNIVGKDTIMAPLASTNGFMFPYTPTITYQQAINYVESATTHSNQDFKSYTNTKAVQMIISGPFTAQNDTEAKFMLACMHFLRTMSKMRFGQGADLGMPPPVMYLNGYGSAMMNQLPVIIENYSVELNNSMDYVKTNVGGLTAWLPTITNISVTVTVQNTPKKLREFNWDSFAKGDLMKRGGWF